MGGANVNTLLTTHQGRSYQTYKQLSEVLTETYPGYTFFLTGPGAPINWDSRAIWYFFRGKESFVLSGQMGQIMILSRKGFQVCERSDNQSSSNCQAVNGEDLTTPLKVIEVQGVSFEVYENVLW